MKHLALLIGLLVGVLAAPFVNETVTAQVPCGLFDSAGRCNVTGAGGTFPVTNAGTFVVQENGAGLTALQLIDNIVMAEDAAHGSGQSGVQLLAVRQDSQVDFAADGDYVPLSINANGELRVAFAGAAGGTSALDDADFTAAVSSFTPVGGFYQSTVTACTDTDTCAFGMTAQRTLKVTLFTSAGVELTANSDATEDLAETAGGTGPRIMSVRRDTAASSAGTTGDNATVNTDSLGRLWTLPGGPCADHARIQRAPINQAIAGNNDELVGEVASNIIYVCGFGIVADGAVEVQFISGTGTDCGTSETDLTGPMSFAANGGIAVPNTGAAQFKTTVAHDLCIELSSGVEVNGWVSYVQTASP